MMLLTILWHGLEILFAVWVYAAIVSKLDTITNIEVNMTGILDLIREDLDRIKAAIADVAADVRALTAKIPGTDSIGQNDALQLKADLDGIADGLEALAAQTPDQPATPAAAPASTDEVPGPAPVNPDAPAPGAFPGE